MSAPGRGHWVEPNGSSFTGDFCRLELLQQLVENCPVLAYAKDAESLRFTLLNRRCEEQFKVPRAALIGLSDYDLFPKEVADRYLAEDRAVLDSRRILEIPVEKVGGELLGNLWFRTRKMGVYDADGKPRYLLCFTENITGEHQSLEKVESLRATLERSAHLATLGEVAAKSLHEFSTPLASIALIADMLERDAGAGPVDAARVIQDARAIVSTVDRMSKTAAMVRRLVRPSDEEPRRRVSLSAVVQESVDLCLSRCQAHGVRVSVEIPDALEIDCRAFEISQVFTNLINNAVDAMHGPEDRWILITADRVTEATRAFVTNGGPVISPDVRARLMEPFFTTKAATGGMGLGLTIARGIAQGHGGTLDLVPMAPNTRFVLTLPTTVKSAP